MNELTVGSLFSGVGGFDLGFERAGFRIAWQVEIDPHACAVLRRHWPEAPLYGDIREVRGGHLSPVDVMIGGFPCQDVSVAGKRAGLAGERSGLYWQLVRVVREQRTATGGSAPSVVVLENVPGLLSADRGRDFAAVLGGFWECGAAVAYRILDAQFFGVAQRRRRVFIVAMFPECGPGDAGERAAHVLALTASGGGHSPARGATREAAPGDAETGIGDSFAPRVDATLGANYSAKHRDDLDSMTFLPVPTTLLAPAGGGRRDRVPMVPAVSAAVSAKWRKGTGGPAGDEVLNLVAAFDERTVTSRGNRSRRDYGSPANTLHGEPLSVIAETVRSHPRPGSNSLGTLAFHARQDPIHGDVSPSLDGDSSGSIAAAIAASAGHHGHSSPRGDGGDNLVISAMQVRRLMPIECERLMGWEDSWTRWGADGKEISDSVRYRLIGNGVVSNVAEWIARRLQREMAVPS